MKKEIFKFRMLTIAFAVFAIGALGTVTNGTSFLRAGITFVTFSFIAFYCLVKEEELVKSYKKSRRAMAKRRRLTVYTNADRGKASVA